MRIVNTTIAIETSIVTVAREIVAAVAGLVVRASALPLDAHLSGSSDSDSPFGKGKQSPPNKRRSSLNHPNRAYLPAMAQLLGACRYEQGMQWQWRLWQGSWQGIG